MPAGRKELYSFLLSYPFLFLSRSVFLLYSLVHVTNEIIVAHNTSDFVFHEETLQDLLEWILVQDDLDILEPTIFVSSQLIDDRIDALSIISVLQCWELLDVSDLLIVLDTKETLDQRGIGILHHI